MSESVSPAWQSLYMVNRLRHQLEDRNFNPNLVECNELVELAWLGAQMRIAIEHSLAKDKDSGGGGDS